MTEVLNMTRESFKVHEIKTGIHQARSSPDGPRLSEDGRFVARVSNRAGVSGRFAFRHSVEGLHDTEVEI